MLQQRNLSHVPRAVRAQLILNSKTNADGIEDRNIRQSTTTNRRHEWIDMVS